MKIKLRHNPKRRRRAKKAEAAPKRRRRRHAKKAAAAPKRRRRRASKAAAAPKRRRRRRRSNPKMMRMNPKRRRRASKKKTQARRRRRRSSGSFGRMAAAPRAPRVSRKATPLAKMAARASREGTRSYKATASAWRAAKRAQKLAKNPKEQAYLRAAGLAGVPNPGLGAIKGIVPLLPAIGAGAGSLLVHDYLGHVVSSKFVKGMLPEAAKPYSDALTTAALTVAVYGMSRNVKMLQKFSLPILLGGGIATVLRVFMKDEPSLAEKTGLPQKLGLPLGEYTAMGEYTAVGEYTAMGAHHGGGGIFAGLDDQDPILLSGTDDDPDFAEGETLEDMGDNEDDGSLSGSIFE